MVSKSTCTLLLILSIAHLQGGREVDDFIQYLAKESTDPMKGFDRKGKKQKIEL